MRFPWQSKDLKDEPKSDYFSDSKDLISPEKIDKNNKALDDKRDEIRRKGFNDALRGKQLNDLLIAEDERIIIRKNRYCERRDTALKPLNDRIDGIQAQISKSHEKLGREGAIKSELKEEREQSLIQLKKLQEEYDDLTSNLGEGYKNLIKNRIAEVKTELESLIDMYNSVFDQKLGEEKERDHALKEYRGTCDDIIKQNKETLKDTQTALDKIYRFGASMFSANFLILIGILAAMATGWFYTIFSTSYDLINQNWIFFSTNNIFNYLSIYIINYGPFYAAWYMLLHLIVILFLISAVVHVSDYMIYRFSTDQSDLQFGVQLQYRKKGFFKFRMRSKSSLWVWFRFLPWIFIFGILFILISVGQFVGDEEDQIREFHDRLSGQIIGFTIALLCAGLYFLYVTKIIEPRKIKTIKKNEREVFPTADETPTKKFPNIELVILIIALNLLLILMVFTQMVDVFVPVQKNWLAIISFLITVNLTGFTLAYGIRQKGLLKTRKISEQQIFYLNKLRLALSGSKPISMWITEERQFQKHFLKIQEELFELIHNKNYLLDQLKKKSAKQAFGSAYNSNKSTFFSKLLFWKKSDIDFYQRNFPELSSRIKETNNAINALSRNIELIKDRIKLLTEGNSSFHIQIKDELRRFEEDIENLKREKMDVELDLFNHMNQLERNLEVNKQAIIEGHGLGKWTVDYLNPNYEN